MWIKGLRRCFLELQKKYGVDVTVRTAVYYDCIEFMVSREYFRVTKIWDAETIGKLAEVDGIIETVLEDMAKQVADAYESTNKSKAWDETLQEIGVREG